MKKVILGGLIFIGGTIMYSIGTLGFADMDVQANYMLTPQYIGIATMLIGAALGFFGLKRIEYNFNLSRLQTKNFETICPEVLYHEGGGNL